MKVNLYSNEYLLVEKKSLYRKLLNQIPDLIFQIHFDSNQKIHINYVNKSVIDYFGVEEHEIKNNSFDSITKRIVPEDLEGFFESLQIAKENNTNWSYEFRANLGSERFCWLKLDATIEKDAKDNVIFFGRFSDRTESKLKECKLSETADRLNFALEASNSGVWDLDVFSDHLFLSKQSMEILNFDLFKGIYPTSFWDSRIHPDDYTNYLSDFSAVLNGESSYFESTKRVLCADNITYKWILSKGKVIKRGENKEVLRMVGTHTDVTLDIQRENELLKNLEIINHQKNRLLNFAHIVSHNLRSHTGNFKMLLNILGEEKDFDQQRQIFEHLNTTSDALADTIEHLKELVDIHSAIVHKKEKLNLNQYLKKTLLLLETEIESNKVTIINNLDDSTSIDFIPAYLESVFLNFTTNAIKYGHPDRNSIIEYSLDRIENNVVLSIKDNGIGINLEKHGSRLFGMYKTFHKNANARGLGLFITKNQVEAMNGFIEVESEVNAGTTFKIFFYEAI